MSIVWINTSLKKRKKTLNNIITEVKNKKLKWINYIIFYGVKSSRKI